MRAKLAIIVSKFLREDGSLEIGGIETYVSQLIEAVGSDYETHVFQLGKNNCSNCIGGTNVIVRNEKSIQDLADYISGSFLSGNDVFIVSTEQLGIKTGWKRTVVIQHGIYWDLPVDIYSFGKISGIAPGLYKIFDNFRNIRRIAGFANIVCVDHAYVNWYRTVKGSRESSRKMYVIPNHADDIFHAVPVSSVNESGQVSILFARRLMRFRGTLLFARVARRLVSENSNIAITICGSGPDEDQMKSILPASDRVNYCVAKHQDMANLISRHDIVVVPSLGSEGTSLSAIEGMAAGRAVVASAVGGLPNVIIDGYNGILVSPDNETELLECLRSLVSERSFRSELSRRAKEVASHSFTFSAWSKRWRQVISDIK